MCVRVLMFRPTTLRRSAACVRESAGTHTSAGAHAHAWKRTRAGSEKKKALGGFVELHARADTRPERSPAISRATFRLQSRRSSRSAEARREQRGTFEWVRTEMECARGACWATMTPTKNTLPQTRIRSSAHTRTSPFNRASTGARPLYSQRPTSHLSQPA